MQMYPESFPSDRRDDPMRRAEARVFDEIQRSRLPGFSYYEWQRDHNSPQLDFPIWLPGVGRFGIEVKGGQYSLRKGKWLLQTSDGPQEKDCPLTKAWDATMALHDELVQIIGYETFFIAVVVFPDMEPDRAIASSAKHSNVYVLWGVDGLVDRLQRIAAARKVYNPPDQNDIEREVAAVTDDQVLYEPPADWRPPPGRGTADACLRAKGSAGCRRRRHHHPARGHAQLIHGFRLEPGGRWVPGH